MVWQRWSGLQIDAIAIRNMKIAGKSASYRTPASEWPTIEKKSRYLHGHNAAESAQVVCRRFSLKRSCQFSP